MNPMATRLRSALLCCVSGLLATALVGCGTPRVHEVYRLSGEPLPMDGSAESIDRLSLAQQDLRRLALQATAMQPRSRDAGQDIQDIESLASVDSRALHECALGYLAAFTTPLPAMPSADWVAAQPSVAFLSHQPYTGL